MAHIDKRETTSGSRYEVRYRDPDSRERSRTFRTRREAERFLTSTRAELDRGTWIDPNAARLTFAVVAAEWLASNPAKRGSTYARDETIIRVHLLPTLGERQLRSITRADVVGLLHAWTKALAPRTTRRMFGTLRAIFNYAVDADYLGRSPARGVTVGVPRPEERRLVNHDELLALADAIGPKWAPLVLTGAVLGLRWGECAGLRVGRIDFLAHTITVAEQITRGIAGRAEAGPPKSDAGNRTVAVPAELIEILSAHLARRGLTGADADALVFGNNDGGPLSYSSFRERHWNRACVAAGLGRFLDDDPRTDRVRRLYEGLTFHDLRRSNATALVAEGVDIKTAQRRLGHSDIRTTLEIYAQATTKADRDAADALAERFLARPRRTPERRPAQPELPGMEIG